MADYFSFFHFLKFKIYCILPRFLSNLIYIDMFLFAHYSSAGEAEN